MKSRKITILGGLAAVLLLGAAPTSALAGLMTIGLRPDGQLIQFDSDTPGGATTLGTISGDTIVDIDYYGPDNQLYGISSGGVLYRINTATGGLTVAANPAADGTNDFAGITVTDLDFNPTADRARIFGTNGTTQMNYRLVPDVITAPSAAGLAGTVISDGAFSLGGSPYTGTLVSSAYTNPFDGAASTTLYSIGSRGGVSELLIHSVGPQFSTVTSVGALGINGTVSGFDIGIDNVAYANFGLIFGTINLSTGAFTTTGAVPFSSSFQGLSSIAVAIPEPGSGGLLAAALCGALVLRRRKRSVIA